ncbi:hypothetical protein NSTC745_00656 [Nostoc sp. DSM 114161]|jgi:hypothetical protein|uniref:hypothetical protein n=1 Tax=Nostoc sp. DSM 114161 TaxID=3440143 RepID=UPI004045724A
MELEYSADEGWRFAVYFDYSQTIRYPRLGSKMPLPFPSLLNNSSVSTFLVASDERKPLDRYWHDFGID